MSHVFRFAPKLKRDKTLSELQAESILKSREQNLTQGEIEFKQSHSDRKIKRTPILRNNRNEVTRENQSVISKLKTNSTYSNMIKNKKHKYNINNNQVFYIENRLVNTLPTLQLSRKNLNILINRIKYDIQFYFNKYEQINRYLTNMIRRIEILTHEDEKRKYFKKMYDLLLFLKEETPEYEDVIDILDGINGLISTIPDTYKLLPFNNSYMYNNFRYNNSNIDDTSILKDSDNFRYFHGIPTTQNRYKLNIYTKESSMNISYKGITLEPLSDNNIFIQKEIGKPTSYKFIFKEFDKSKCKLENKESGYVNISNILIDFIIQKPEINIKILKNPQINVHEQRKVVDKSKVSLLDIKEHFNAIILDKICRYVDIKTGLIKKQDTIAKYTLTIEKILNYIQFLYKNINKYIKLLNIKINETYVSEYHKHILLHFYFAIFLKKSLLNPTRLNQLNEELKAKIRLNKNIIKHIYSICKRLMKYNVFNYSYDIDPIGTHNYINISNKIYRYSKLVLDALKNFICDGTIISPEELTQLIGYNICEDELDIIILKKILNETSKDDFSTYIEYIISLNIKNIKKLFKKVIYKISQYLYQINYYDIVPNILKIPNQFKTNVNDENDIIKNVLCYVNSELLPDRISLNTYNATQPIREGNMFSQTFLHQLLRDPNYINTIIGTHMIQDDILAKILYFYYVTFKPIQNRGSGRGFKLSSILQTHEINFFIDILEYQFYLCHILQKRKTDVRYRINDNYYKATVFFKRFCPKSYDILKDIYSSRTVNIDDTLIELKNDIGEFTTFFKSDNTQDHTNPDYKYKVYNIGKIINQININNTSIESDYNQIQITEQLPFIKCYNDINKITNITNVIRFNALLNLRDEIRNLINHDHNITKLILCLYNFNNYNTYIDIGQDSQEEKKIKSTNIFKTMPYVLFYYYKAILHTQQEVDQGAGEEPRLLIPSQNINFYLTICLHIFQIYNHILRHINIIQPFHHNILPLKNLIYKINKIAYKTIEDLVNNHITISANQTNIDIMNKINQINDIRRGLSDVYSRNGIGVNKYGKNKDENNPHNYLEAMIPNFNQDQKEITYGMIERENAEVRRAINYLQNKGQQLGNLPEKLNGKYKMLKAKEIPYNVNHFKSIENHTNNHLFFRKLFNNEKNGINHPLYKYYKHFSERKI